MTSYGITDYRGLVPVELFSWSSLLTFYPAPHFTGRSLREVLACLGRPRGAKAVNTAA